MSHLSRYRIFRVLVALLNIAALTGAVSIAPATAGTTIAVTTTTDESNSDGDCSLREAIAAAETDTKVDRCPAGAGSDTVQIPAGTYTLTIDQFVVNTALRVVGAGAAKTIIDASPGRFMHVLGAGDVTIAGVTLAWGTENAGGAVFTEGRLRIVNATLSGNTASFGGAVYNTGTSTIVNSTLSANSSTVGGGGAVINIGTLTIVNSTLSGNSASGSGGGVYSNATLTIASSTLSGNSSSDSGGGVGNGGGSLTLVASIVAGNTPVNCSGTISNGGHNLTYPGASCPGTQADPLLSPLANNGGPTPTMALNRYSPALDRIEPDDPDCPDTDQRGISRPRGDACDIGAYEHYRMGSRTTITWLLTSKKVNASGIVRPPHPGSFLRVALYRERSGRFVLVERKRVILDEQSRYATQFGRPRASRCRLVAAYPGDFHHRPSRATSTFRC